MVRLNVIYTRTGDKGETGLGDGSRRSKTDARVAAMGDVDETNCAIGLALLAVRHASDAADLAIEPVLTRIQNDLFDLGADLCLPRQPEEKAGSVLRIAPSQVQALEHAALVRAQMHTAMGGFDYTPTRLGRTALATGAVARVVEGERTS